MKKVKAASVLFNITTVFCFIYFALYIFTLIFIPIGIECFIAGRRFSYRAENPENTVVLPNKILKNWVIFVSIFVFPFGLLSIIGYRLLVGNSVTVGEACGTGEAAASTAQSIESSEKIYGDEERLNVTVEGIDSSQAEDLAEGTRGDPDSGEGSEAASSPREETEEEKLEKFKKLEKFQEKGLITAEELEQAREQLFGKKGE